MYLKKAAVQQPIIDSALLIENDLQNHGESSLKDPFYHYLFEDPLFLATWHPYQEPHT